MPKVALMILFNHNYEQNLTRLDEIYKERFEEIWYIIPFYKGTRDDVIIVYENSYNFQSYIAKALEQVRHERFDHYMVISDDLLLNPKINQHNYLDFFLLSTNSAFIPGLFLLNDVLETRPYRPFAPYWFWIHSAIDFRIDQRGIQASEFLPTYDQALEKLALHGFNFNGVVSWRMFLWKMLYSKHIFKILTDRTLYKKAGVALYFFFTSLMFSKKIIRYPLIGSYSDILIVPHQSSYNFMRYCGIFGALNLFVEIALPTALAFSTTQIVNESCLKFEARTLWTPDDISGFEMLYDNNLTRLLDNFPDNVLYVHPIKLSRWRS